MRREVKRFLDAHPPPAIDGRFEDDYTEYVIYVIEDFATPPDSFSTRLGDAIHNYRCVLDHIAWQLVLNGATPKPDREDLVQFPIYSTRKKFRSQRAHRLPGVSRGPIQFIESRQPYPGRDAADYPLGTLAKLSNDDKHRSIHTVVAGIARADLNWDCTDCVVTGHFASDEAPLLKAGTPIAGLFIERTGPNPKVKVDLTIAAHVTLEDRRGVNLVVERIKAEVTKLLYAPEIVSAV